MARLYIFYWVLGNRRSALRAELACGLGAALRALLRAFVSWDWRSAFRAELASGLSTALRAFLGCLWCWERFAAVGAELACDRSAAFWARHALWLVRNLSLVLRVLWGHHAAAHHVTCSAEAHAGHADTHEACACTCFVAGGGSHGAEHATSCLSSVGTSLEFVELLLALFVEGDGFDEEADQADATSTDVGVKDVLVHEFLHVGCAAWQFECPDLVFFGAEGVDHGLQGSNHLAAHLLGKSVFLDYIAHTGVLAHEQSHIVKTEGVFAIATDVQGKRSLAAIGWVEAAMVPILEHDRRCGAELVSHDLLDVEEEHGLFLGGSATIGKTLPHFLEDRTELASKE